MGQRDVLSYDPSALGQRLQLGRQLEHGPAQRIVPNADVSQQHRGAKTRAERFAESFLGGEAAGQIALAVGARRGSLPTRPGPSTRLAKRSP